MSEQISEKQCPKCGAKNSVAELPQREYRCGDCGLELAHLDTNAQGAIRGVLGWLLDVGAEVGGRYRVTAVLGKGGFGVTYLVDDLRLQGKHRALKEIPESLFDEHETLLLGRLSHPAVPDITDRFTLSGMVYLVLEFGGTRTLRIEQERRGGRIPLFVLLPWIRQICDALQYLHEQDPPVVHRDLKPDNVLLDDNDRIMLIDFGIAKEATKDSVTRTLGRAVSHGFSPPEQALGTGTDARSDVYALGAIMYNLLTSQMPAGAHERITGATIEPLSTFLPEIPPLIEAAVMKALELNINLRQQSISELAQVFDLVQSGSGSAATVSVAGVETVTAPSGPGQVVLPSVQLPSVRSSSPGGTQPAVQIQQPATAAPAKPPRKGSRAAIFALLAASVAAAGGGYWYLSQNGLIGEIAGGEGDSKSQSGEEKPATAPAVATGGGASSKAASVETSGGTEPSNAQLSPTSASVSAAAAAARLKKSAGKGPGESVSTASAPGSAPAYAPSELPSIFSSEQTAAGAPAQGSSGGSLMDVFEKHRSESMSEQPMAMVPPATLSSAAASPKPEAKKEEAAPAPKPKPKKTKRRVAKRKAARPKSRQSAPKSSSGWTIIRKGSTKEF